MISVMVCGGRAFKDWRLLYAVMDDLLVQYGKIEVRTWETIGVGALTMRWARERPDVTLNDLVIFDPAPDLVVAFPGIGIEKPLRRAWKQRIPALKVSSEGVYVRIGLWAELTKKRRLRAV